MDNDSCISIEANEEATLTLDIKVTDADGNEVVPTVASWALTNREGVVINGRSDVSITPATTMRVNIAGDDLIIEDSTNEREYRLFTVKADRGDVNEPETIETPFWVKNLKNIT